MTTTTEKQPTAKPPKPKNPIRPSEPDVADAVMAILGRPKGLNRVIARVVGLNRFRVNVFTDVPVEGLMTTRTSITDSFYVHTTPHGEIIKSSPELKKKYV